MGAKYFIAFSIGAILFWSVVLFSQPQQSNPPKGFTGTKDDRNPNPNGMQGYTGQSSDSLGDHYRKGATGPTGYTGPPGYTGRKVAPPVGPTGPTFRK